MQIQLVSCGGFAPAVQIVFNSEVSKILCPKFSMLIKMLLEDFTLLLSLCVLLLLLLFYLLWPSLFPVIFLDGLVANLTLLQNIEPIIFITVTIF